MSELPSVGDEFAGYRLRAVLGRGGMSVVFQADNPRLGNVIAVKVLAPELASDDKFRTRFLEESRTAASMNHPNVIPIHDMGSSGGLLYIAMRWVSGTDLRQMIKERGRLQPETAVFLLSQAARALDAGHARGLVHRDVKPGNLLIEHGNDDSDPDHVYLADFGITKRGMTRTGLTSTGRFLGTVDYVAPEQIRGLAAQGTADQYSLGCVLYECLTGSVPFEKDLDAAVIWAHVEELPARPSLLQPDLPFALDDVFGRVLAKQPDDRYGDCREFMAAARAALAGVAVAGVAAVADRRAATAATSVAIVTATSPASAASATTATSAAGNAAALLAWYADSPVRADYAASADEATAAADLASAEVSDPAPAPIEPPATKAPGNVAALLAWYTAPVVPPDYPVKAARADVSAETSSGHPAEPAPVGYLTAAPPVGHLPTTAGAYPTAPWRINVPPKAVPANVPADRGYPAEPEPLAYPTDFSPAGYPADPERINFPPKLAPVGGYHEEADVIRFPVGVAPRVGGGYLAEAGPDDYPATGYPPDAGAGYPAELMHELTEPADDTAVAPLPKPQFAGSPRDGSTLSPGTLPYRRPAAAATPAGASVSEDWPPRREPRPRRGRWAGITAAVVLTAGAGGAAYAAVHHETSAKPEPSVTTPAANSPAVSP